MSLNGLNVGPPGWNASKPLPSWQSNIGIVLLFVFVVPVFLVSVMIKGRKQSPPGE